MEAKNKSSEIGCGKEKRRSQIGLTVGGGGGIGGLVVVGGALAVAGLMAAFTVFKSRSIRKEDVDEDEDTVEKFTITNEKNDANGEGLRSVIQTPPIIVHQNSCQEISKIGVTVNEIESCESDSIDNLVLDEKSAAITEARKENSSNDSQEIIISDESNQEKLGSDHDIVSVDETENVIQNSSEESLQPVETVEEIAEGKLDIEEDFPVESVEEYLDKEEDDYHDDSAKEHVKLKWAVENNFPITSPEEEGDSEEEHVPEKEEESSEGVRSASSMESNVEAIWPAEMIDALSLEIKEKNVSNQNSQGKIVEEDPKAEITENKKYGFSGLDVDDDEAGSEDGDDITTESSTTLSEEKCWEELVMVNDQPVAVNYSSKWRVVRWSPILVVLLLLLLLLHVRRIATPDDTYDDYVIVS